MIEITEEEVDLLLDVLCNYLENTDFCEEADDPEHCEKILSLAEYLGLEDK